MQRRSRRWFEIEASRSSHTSPTFTAVHGRARRSTSSIGPGLNHRSRSTGRPSAPRAPAISLSREYPHSSSSPITKPNRSQSPSSCSAPSVTNQVNDESGVNNLTCTIGVGHDSCEYSGGRVFLSSTGSSSTAILLLCCALATGNGGERSSLCSDLFSEQRELTVRFDDEGPSSRRLLFEPLPKNQGRSCAVDCDHFIDRSGDHFFSEFLIEHR